MSDGTGVVQRPERGNDQSRLLTLGVGVISIVAGVAVAVWPEVSLLVLSQVAGWVMWVVGFVVAVRIGRDGRWRSVAFVGAVTAGIVGLVLALWPGRTLLVATVLAGAWLIINGMARVFGTISAPSARAEVIGNLLGIAEAILGVIVIARPVGGVRAAAIVVGAGLLVHGVAEIRDAITGRSGDGGRPADAPVRGADGPT